MKQIEKQVISDFESYSSRFPAHVQKRLIQMRETVRINAPDAVESIAYGMPAYKLKGRPLVYFAAFKAHIGFYALPSAQAEFRSELAHFRQGKGSVQFPMNEPLPLDLIGRMVRYRVGES
jgi:uncharacterized protein YdhG (YjbR/CyaY superfamily)